MSFAAVPFACAVFDEMQKVKSPSSSLLTQAAKTVNADFIVGLTGTPIENRLADLWCIMDIVSPGYLGDLRSFSERYQADDYGALSSASFSDARKERRRTGADAQAHEGD